MLLLAILFGVSRIAKDVFDEYNPKKSVYKSTTIMDVQGEFHTSTYENKFVQIRGVVTKMTDRAGWRGFFIQMEPEQAYDRGVKSTGIFVKNDKFSVTVGDVVIVKGNVFEMYVKSFFENEPEGLTMTSMTAHDVSIDGHRELTKEFAIEAFSNQMPKEVVYAPNPFLQSPLSIGKLNIERGMDYWESLEGMYVKLSQPVVSQAVKYDAMYVYGKLQASNVNSKGGLTVVQDRNGIVDFQPESLAIFMKEIRRQTVKFLNVGDELEDIYGVVIYEKGAYGLYVDSEIRVKEKKKKTVNVAPKTANLRIASYNVLNLQVESKHRDKIASQIVNELKLPSIVGLIEIVDDYQGSGSSDEILTYLCESINAENDIKYAFTYIKTTNGSDGGKPGNNIKQAILYDLNIFKQIKSSNSAYSTCNESFSINPCRIEPENEFFEDSRKPLAAKLTFLSSGDSIVVILNHFKSLIGSSPLYGRVQPPTIGSYDKRLGQAKVVANFISKLTTKVVCMGDLNDLENSDTYKVFSSFLHDTHHVLSPVERFSYIHNGISQKIDYIFANDALIQEFVASDIIHANSVFQQQTSDHDILYADFKM